MPCRVPEQFSHIRWHAIRPDVFDTDVTEEHGPWWRSGDKIEIAEWVHDPEGNGPSEGGHWLRWGKTGDFPSLCQAEYIGPLQDQEIFNIERYMARVQRQHDELRIPRWIKVALGLWLLVFCAFVAYVWAGN
jgi:hypothetical protein